MSEKEMTKEDMVKLEKELLKDYQKKLKQPPKKDIITLEKRIKSFLKKKEAGTLLFTSMDKDMNPKHEFICIRANKRMMKAIMRDYLELNPIKDALIEMNEENKVEKEPITKMVR
ncbi:MAG: hypothetical protein PHD05_05165 [Sphaerochaetaceae bacterium]|nr:hypothetical protein [Sphaerochaetaceae bacterium]